jgi:hypothetical protein
MSNTLNKAVKARGEWVRAYVVRDRYGCSAYGVDGAVFYASRLAAWRAYGPATDAVHVCETLARVQDGVSKDHGFVPYLEGEPFTPCAWCAEARHWERS